MQRDIAKVLLTERELSDRIRELGKEITRDYNGKPLHLVGILKGSVVFMTDLMRTIDLPLTMDFMAVSSYGSGVKTSGVVQVIKDLSTPIEGKDVLVVEDILDSGLTLSYLIDLLKGRGPASVEVAAFLVKDVAGKTPAIEPRYVGTHVPDEFIVGYGLDFAERYRNLPYIGVLKPEVYQ